MSKYDVSKFRNVTVALNTPFKKDGSVDVEAIKAVCSRTSSWSRCRNRRNLWCDARALSENG